MSRINMARVLLGGLAAGLLINIGEYLLHDVVLAEEIRATMAGFNLPAPGGGAIAVFVFLGFGVGLTAVWLYAAIRPRYGAGPKVALCAGSAVWFLAYAYPGVAFAALGFFPVGDTVFVLIWQLVEVSLGTLAGAWVYQE